MLFNSSFVDFRRDLGQTTDDYLTKFGEVYMGALKWGLEATLCNCAQSSTILHFCGPFGPLSKGNFRHKMTTIMHNCGQLP